jgi:hypothetical protein
MVSETQSQIEELMPLVVGKVLHPTRKAGLATFQYLMLIRNQGVNMRLFIDHSKPEDSPGYNWVETTYDGKDDSDFLAVPSHWHKVCSSLLIPFPQRLTKGRNLEPR